ncbi:UNKNOWN [Stylonychia lemnae]|uniref:Uncharacterized protein n=1 Tax=Stylonychia lemnae TaxID=5949 RepID=A0A078A310_STYLE|nr:UNKNOWN [Stylonychia lemnae]|eukprot:CDW75878.1 UNKNOWN [Stylonychia lemnae]
MSVSTTQSPEITSQLDNYDEIFENYSRIWREAIAQDYQTHFKGLENQEMSGKPKSSLFSQVYQSVAPATTMNSNLLRQPSVYSGQTQNNNVILEPNMNTQQLLDQFTQKVDQLNQQLIQNREDRVQGWAQKIIYAFKIYSTQQLSTFKNQKGMQFTNPMDKLKDTNLSLSKGALQNSRQIGVNSNNQFLNKGINSQFSSPSIGSANYNDYSYFSGSNNMSSGMINGKHQTRQHLVENIRQPLFPLMTNDAGQVLQPAQQPLQNKMNFDNDDIYSSQQNVDFIVCNNKQQKVNTHVNNTIYPTSNNNNMTNNHISNLNNNSNNITGDFQSIKTQGGGASNSSRTKDEENDFNFSFDEDFFFEIQKGGIDLDE